jgi:hypothetical protein
MSSHQNLTANISFHQNGWNISFYKSLLSSYYSLLLSAFHGYSNCGDRHCFVFLHSVGVRGTHEILHSYSFGRFYAFILTRLLLPFLFVRSQVRMNVFYMQVIFLCYFNMSSSIWKYVKIKNTKWLTTCINNIWVFLHAELDYFFGACMIFILYLARSLQALKTAGIFFPSLLGTKLRSH